MNPFLFYAALGISTVLFFYCVGTLVRMTESRFAPSKLVLCAYAINGVVLAVVLGSYLRQIPETMGATTLILGAIVSETLLTRKHRKKRARA